MSPTQLDQTPPTQNQSDQTRIAFVTPYDADDITQASGTGYHIIRSLMDAGVDVQQIGGLKYQYHPVNILKHLWNQKVLKKNDHPHRDPGFLRHFAKQVERSLRPESTDLVVGSGGLPLAYLETELPILLWTDCTFATLLDYYEKFKGMSARSLRDAQHAEQSLFDRVDWVIMTSQWAADSAVRDYGFPEDRITVIPRGANIPAEPTLEEIQRHVAARPTDRIDLIFLGKFWKRKRGDIAEATAVELNRRGIPTTLRLVGGRPDDAPPMPDCVEVVPYINKSDPAGWEAFSKLLYESHALLLPTEADCTPIVFCEASAMGTPSISTRTGAVPSVLTEGKNGMLLDLSAGPMEYADAVMSMLEDRKAYEVLCTNAYNEYKTRFNWPTSAARASETFKAAIAAGKRAAP